MRRVRNNNLLETKIRLSFRQNMRESMVLTRAAATCVRCLYTFFSIRSCARYYFVCVSIINVRAVVTELEKLRIYGQNKKAFYCSSGGGD